MQLERLISLVVRASILGLVLFVGPIITFSAWYRSRHSKAYQFYWGVGIIVGSCLFGVLTRIALVWVRQPPTVTGFGYLLWIVAALWILALYVAWPRPIRLLHWIVITTAVSVGSASAALTQVGQ